MPAAQDEEAVQGGREQLSVLLVWCADRMLQCRVLSMHVQWQDGAAAASFALAWNTMV